MLDVDAAVHALTPEQWDELVAADEVEPLGERRADMRLAFLIAQMWNMKLDKSENWLSTSDVLGWFDLELQGKSITSPQHVSPEQMARIGRGGR